MKSAVIGCAGTGGLAAALLGGCACLGEDLIASGRVAMDVRIDRSLRQPPAVCADSGDLVVSGRLERGAPTSTGGHIDISVVAPHGAAVYDARVEYLSDAASSSEPTALRRASFQRAHSRYGGRGVYLIRFRGLPPDGSVVRVKYDPARPVAQPADGAHHVESD